MASILPVGNGSQILLLDAGEAGFLKDVLNAHVAGSLTVGDAPLARIREALAPVNRRRARVSRVFGCYGYAVLEAYENAEDEAYELNHLYDALEGMGF